MVSSAAAVPDERSTLCEGCGYTLDGLAEESKCPECGRSISESTSLDRRGLPEWESSARPGVMPFVRTTMQVLLRPSHFFRTIVTRDALPRSRAFGAVHWTFASMLFAGAATAHLLWNMMGVRPPTWALVLAFVGFGVGTFLFLTGITWLANRLTGWEGRYRGLRMPAIAIRRVMYYHSAHYLPVAFIACVTAIGYSWLVSRRIVGAETGTTYLWTLCGEVVASAAYLFKTYWAGMRNIMYANR